MGESKETTKASRLRDARIAQGLGLRKLEQETGLSRGTISRIENGALKPNVHHLLVLGRALGIRDLVRALERFTDE